MKNKILFFAIFAISIVNAQKDIPNVYVNINVSTHFLSKEKLTYSDLSTKNIVGDFPLDNILRIKPLKETGDDLGYVTIVAESFIKQFRVLYVTDPERATKKMDLDNITEDRFNHPEIDITSLDIKRYSQRLLDQKPSHIRKGRKKHKMQVFLNSIHVMGDYFFIDYSVVNESNIQYNVDEIRYSIIDKKVKKSENSQSIEIPSLYNSNKANTVSTSIRNVVVLKKFTFPDKKKFQIEINENQISGRSAIIEISYKDILSARKIGPTKNIASTNK